MYEKAQLALVKLDYTESINLRSMYTEGDRSGHLHIGYNQSLVIGMK